MSLPHRTSALLAAAIPAMLAASLTRRRTRLRRRAASTMCWLLLPNPVPANPWRPTGWPWPRW
ncbi:hypothetical protein [Streptomyces sp. NPDC006552]|uniref:hypothetical protein n=1 Tax=Streptomyces sp. NPDC006552 TaxID=3157179 RepID=UPI0033A9CBB8